MGSRPVTALGTGWMVITGLMAKGGVIGAATALILLQQFNRNGRHTSLAAVECGALSMIELWARIDLFTLLSLRTTPSGGGEYFRKFSVARLMAAWSLHLPL